MTNVAALKGGWAAWQQAGYPVEGQQASRLTPAPTVALPPLAGGQTVAALGDPNAPVTILEFSDFQ